MIVYFSNVSENTKRFVDKLTIPAVRIPVNTKEAEEFKVTEPYVLIVPSYGDKQGSRFVPHQVKRFLSNKENASLMKGVIGAGNINFNEDYCKAAKIVSQKFNIPVLYMFELLGNPEDVEKVSEGVKNFLLSDR